MKASLRGIGGTKNIEPLAVSFRRIRKILGRVGPAEVWRLPAVRPELFTEEAEKELHAAAAHAAREAAREKRAGNYGEALRVIGELGPAVDRFFDDVLVMAEEESTLRNRLIAELRESSRASRISR